MFFSPNGRAVTELRTYIVFLILKLFLNFAGKLYRDTILLPGSSRDELVSLKVPSSCHKQSLRLMLHDAIFVPQEFLGREPNSDAFLKALFGTVPRTNL